MKIGIIGATGITGSEVLKKLGNQKVAAFVRTPSKLSDSSNLEITQGDVEDTAKLKAWANNLDVVIVAIGHSVGWSQIGANLGLSKFAKAHMMSNAVEALIQSNVKRIVYLSAYGTRETRSQLPFIFGKIFQ
jgi:putative NADH-flavin reductase